MHSCRQNLQDPTSLTAPRGRGACAGTKCSIGSPEEVLPHSKCLWQEVLWRVTYLETLCQGCGAIFRNVSFTEKSLMHTQQTFKERLNFTRLNIRVTHPSKHTWHTLETGTSCPKLRKSKTRVDIDWDAQPVLDDHSEHYDMHNLNLMFWVHLRYLLCNDS